MNQDTLDATSLTVEQAAAVTGLSRTAVRARIAARTLYAYRTREGLRLPSVQFVPGGALPGLDAVLPRLPRRLTPAAVVRWLAEPHPALVVEGEARPLSPREWLRSGRAPEAVTYSHSTTE